MATRLAPRTLLFGIRGVDDGQFGGAALGGDDRPSSSGSVLPCACSQTRARRAAWPGSSRTSGSAGSRSSRGRLAGVDVLVPHAVVQLAVSTVRHLARASEFMRVTGDPAAFEAAIRAAVPEFGALPPRSRFDEPPLDVRRTPEPDGTLALQAGRCRFEYRRPRPRLTVVTISGHDDGALGASPLDELTADLRGRPGRLLLFVDARDTRGVATQVRDLWSAWFQAHRDELDAVHVLSATPLVQLNLGLGRQLSRTGDLMRLHTDAAEFDRALAEASGG